MKHGDFTQLAASYAAYRPGYSPFVISSVLAVAGHGAQALSVADVGAGTGILSRQLAGQGCKVVAVEPNDAMRGQGQAGNGPLAIDWRAGSAEMTGLTAGSVGLVTMASAFHWADFNQAVAEFARILTPQGYFMALWNPRAIERNPLLVEIESALQKLVPELKRVSSGRSEFCDGLLQRLDASNAFRDVMYLEGFHTERQSRERYIGLWESVNDIRVQAGPERFAKFMDYVKDVTKDVSHIEASYQTRAWLAKK